MSALKIIRWIAWALVAVVIFVVTGVAVGWLRTEWLGQSPPGAVATTGTPLIGGPFSLVNHRGERVTHDTFKGKATAYFFGFTHCPEVCPTTLFEMTQHLKELGPDADRLNVVFVTVDPERDTPETLKTYLESFDSRIIGLSGSREQIKAVEAAFEAPLGKDADKGGRSHSSAFFLMDKYGLLAKPIDYTEPQEIENMAKRLLKQ
jgi:protein SCO1/2